MSNYILKVDMEKPVHENFLGNAAVYHGYAGMSDCDGRVYTEEQCEMEADRAAEIGLKIARTMYKWYGNYDKETDTWDWDTHDMNAFVKWCQRLKDRNIDIALQAGWCNPGDVNGTSWNGGCPYGVEGDFEASLKNYTSWMVQTVRYLVLEKGLTNVKYLLMFTEPQNIAGEMPEGYANCYETWCAATKALHEALVKADLRHLVKLVGPNEGSTTTSVMVKAVAETVKDYIDIFSSHNYLSSWADENCGYEAGENNVVFRVPGARIQQNVVLKPNTDYEVKVVMRACNGNDKYISGNVLFGAFEPFNSDDRNDYFSAGGDPTTRLNLLSTKMIDAVHIEKDWCEYSHIFNTGDETEVRIGVFSDIKQREFGIYLRSVVLTEKGDNKNLLNNSDFSNAGLVYNTAAPDDVAKWGWKTMAASVAADNPYYDWHTWVKTGMDFLPEGKKDFWFDEYNVNGPHFDDHTTPLFGSRLAQAMLALMTSGAQSSIMWTLFDQLWPGSHSSAGDAFHDGEHRWGVMPTLFRSDLPYPAYYAAGLAFRYAGGGEGTKIYKSVGGDPIFASVTVSPDGKVGVLVANTHSGEREFEIDFSKILGVKLQKRLYDPATIVPNKDAKQLPVIAEFEVEDTLKDVLPSYGVAVYSNLP